MHYQETNHLNDLVYTRRALLVGGTTLATLALSFLGTMTYQGVANHRRMMGIALSDAKRGTRVWAKIPAGSGHVEFHIGAGESEDRDGVTSVVRTREIQGIIIQEDDVIPGFPIELSVESISSVGEGEFDTSDCVYVQLDESVYSAHSTKKIPTRYWKVSAKRLKIVRAPPRENHIQKKDIKHNLEVSAWLEIFGGEETFDGRIILKNPKGCSFDEYNYIRRESKKYDFADQESRRRSTEKGIFGGKDKTPMIRLNQPLLHPITEEPIQYWYVSEHYLVAKPQPVEPAAQQQAAPEPAQEQKDNDPLAPASAPPAYNQADNDQEPRKRESWEEWASAPPTHAYSLSSMVRYPRADYLETDNPNRPPSINPDSLDALEAQRRARANQPSAPPAKRAQIGSAPPLPSSAHSSSSQDDPWTCVQCTYYNQASHLMCEMCGIQKGRKGF